MAPPHFQGSVGGGTSCAQRTSLMLCRSHRNWAFFNTPTRDITGYHPNYFLLGFRATPSIPTSKRSSSCSFKEKEQAGLQGPPGASPSPADLLQLGARTLQRASWKDAKNVENPFQALIGVFPSRGKSMYIVHIWLTRVAGGRAVPPDAREEPGGALYVHSP